MWLIALLGLSCAVQAVSVPNETTIQLSSTALNAGGPVLDAFLSYSIEFAFFPDFAGQSGASGEGEGADKFRELQSTEYILLQSAEQPRQLDRQESDHKSWREHPVSLSAMTSNGILTSFRDYALYNASLPVATVGINTQSSQDYPTILTIGPSFFDSYSTWPGTTYIHGFNLAKNGTVGLNSLLATVPLACKALENGKLAYWELGNEPDLYKTSAQGIVRPANWTEQSYVDEWLNKTRMMRTIMAQSCPDLPFDFIAPSFAGTSNSLDPIITWRDGLDQDKDISLISSHKYALQIVPEIRGLC